MPRKILIRTADYPYHITNRSNNRDFFYLPMESLWPIFLEGLKTISDKFGCRIHAFVLMSNHYHLIVSTPEANIGDAMKYFHREIARRANREAKRTNHFFGGRYKWAVIGQEAYYWNALKYVIQNPVRANICKSVYDYKYSSLNSPAEGFDWVLTDHFNNKNKKVVLDSDWLEAVYNATEREHIRKALRRREFGPPRDLNGFRSNFDVALRKKGTVTG